MRSTSEPRSRLLTFMPTCLQIQRVTRSLSPVRIFVVTPCSFRARSASAVDFFGGSRKARYPINTISPSSRTLYVSTVGRASFWAIAMTRMPFSFKESTVAMISLRISSVSGCICSLYSAKEQTESISSTAPFVIICRFPFLSSTTVDRRRREKSKGISSTLW